MNVECSKTVEVCFNCFLLAKSLRFYGSLYGKILLPLRFIVNAFYYTRIFQPVLERLRQNDELFHYSLFRL